MSTVGVQNAIEASRQLNSAVKYHLDRPVEPVNGNDAAERRNAASVAMNLLDDSINLLDERLSAHKKFRQAKATSQKLKAKAAANSTVVAPPKSVKKTTLSTLARPQPLAAASSSDQSGKDLVSSLGKADEPLKKQAKTIQSMVESTRPTIDNYNALLQKPYLEQYNALLNAAPTLAIQDGNVVYLKGSLTADGSGIDYGWSTFSALPTGVQINADTSSAIFPFKGDLYLSVGKNTWVKKVRSKDDPAVKNGVNNFPALYNDNWEGSGVLSDDQYKTVVLYAFKGGDNSTSEKLVLLDNNSKLKYLKSDSLSANSEWTELKSGNDDKTPTPTFVSLAFSVGLIGLDNQNNLHKITVNLDSFTYTTKKEKGTGTPSNITAISSNDKGVVAITQGQLQNRIIDYDTSTPDDTKYTWKKMSDVGSAAHIGVASPGILVDLRFVTTYLKGAYMDTQASVYPVIESLRGFYTTHEFYLKKLLEVKDKSPDTIKSEGAKFIKHCKLWSSIVGNKITGAQTSVVRMANQMIDINNQLHIQLQVLRDNLDALKAKLAGQQDQLDKLTVQLWVSIGLVILGILIAIAGAVTGNPLIVFAGGALVAGGVTWMGVTASSIGDIKSQISDTQNQIRTTTQSISNLESIVNIYDNIKDSYQSINEFWGRIKNDASNIQATDEATQAMVGEGILEDTSSIEAAISLIDEIQVGCTDYLDVLNKQGIIVPDESSNVALKVAHGHLKADRFNSYISATAKYSTTLKNNATFGSLFDMEKLRQSASAYTADNSDIYNKNIASLASLPSSMIASLQSVSVNDVNNGFPDTKAAVIDSLLKIQQFADVIVKIKQLAPETPNEAIKPFIKTALDKCGEARSASENAKNVFGTFQQKAQDYYYKIQGNISETHNSIDARKAKYDGDLKSLSPPWYVIIGGAAAIAIWYGVERSNLEHDFENDLNGLNDSLNKLNDLLNSGATASGSQLNWIQFMEAVSGDLGRVYNDIYVISTDISVGAAVYQELISDVWDQIRQNCAEVLSYLSQVQARKAVLRSKVLRAAMPKSANDTNLLSTLSAPAGASASLKNQSSSAKNMFEVITQLKRMKDLDGLVAYWQDDENKVTLAEVVRGLENDYISLIKKSYPNILELQSFAQVQKYRVNNLGKKTLTPEVYLKNSSYETNKFLSNSQKLKDDFNNAKANFAKILDSIDKSIKAINTQLKEVEKKIQESEDAYKKAVAALVGSIIATLFAMASLAIAFGFVPGVAVTLTSIQLLGLGATAAGGVMGTVIAGMTLAQISETIQKLKTVKNELTKTVEQFKKVQPLFTDLVGGVSSLTTVWDDVTRDITLTKENQDAIAAIRNISEKDAKALAKTWDSISDSCIAWMDVINAQGIIPETPESDL